MEEYIREWQINSPEINIVHTKGREAAVVKVTGVMPNKKSWDQEYFLVYFNYNLYADRNFIEIVGKEDYSYSSVYDLNTDNEGRFTYYFKLKNVDELPAGTTKTIKLTHTIEANIPVEGDADDNYERTIIFSQAVNVNITIKEEVSMPPSPNPAVPPKITNDPTVPTITNDPEKPTVTVTPTDTTTPTIVPEATDTNSILLYAGLFVAALVLIKK